MTLDVVLMVALVGSGLWTVMTARVLRSAIGLALTSAVLAVVMFRLNSPLAGVFELSVCAGLIPAILIAAIGLTRRLDAEAAAVRQRQKLRRFAPLAAILLAVGLALWLVPLPDNFFIFPAVGGRPGGAQDVRNVLWNLRQVDLLGQMLVLAAAAFGVVVLVKGARRD